MAELMLEHSQAKWIMVERIILIANALALLLGGGYYITRIEAQTKLLAQTDQHFSELLETHKNVPAHDGADKDIKALTKEVSRLVAVVARDHEDIQEVKDNVEYLRRQANNR